MMKKIIILLFSIILCSLFSLAQQCDEWLYYCRDDGESYTYLECGVPAPAYVYCPDSKPDCRGESFVTSSPISSDQIEYRLCFPNQGCLESDDGFDKYTPSDLHIGSWHPDDLVCSDECSGDYVQECGCFEEASSGWAIQALYCEDGCSDGACYDVQDITCEDSDGGQVYYEKGSVTLTGNEPVEDVCYNEDLLREYACNEAGDNYLIDNHICNNGCVDGACNPEVTECKDTDGGKDYFEVGTTSAPTRTPETDVCDNETGRLKEWYCDGDLLAYVLHDCVCCEGVCVRESCVTDSDCVDCDDCTKDKCVKGIISKRCEHITVDNCDLFKECNNKGAFFTWVDKTEYHGGWLCTFLRIGCVPLDSSYCRFRIEYPIAVILIIGTGTLIWYLKKHGKL